MLMFFLKFEIHKGFTEVIFNEKSILLRSKNASFYLETTKILNLLSKTANSILKHNCQKCSLKTVLSMISRFTYYIT